MLALFLMGAPVGTLLPRLAEIKQGIGASAGSFGTAVALGGAGAVLGNWAGAKLAHRFGTKPMGQWVMVLMLAANVANALVTDSVGLALVNVAGGFGYSLCFVSMNSQGVLVEQHLGKSFLPLMHAWWSLGTMVTAGLSSLVAPYCTPLQALVSCDIVCILAWAVVTRGLLPPEYDEHPHNDPTQLPARDRIPGAALRFLMIIAVAQWFALQADISVADWSSVLLKEDFSVPVGPNGYGYTVFTVVQLATRLVAPRLVDRHGLSAVVRTLGLMGGLGYLLFLALASVAGSPQSSLVLMCLGYAGIALGVAVMPPAFATAAGAIPGLPSSRALMITGAVTAVFSVFGRIGLAFFAQSTSLPLALGVMGVFLMLAAAMSPVLRPERAKRLAIVR